MSSIFTRCQNCASRQNRFSGGRRWARLCAPKRDKRNRVPQQINLYNPAFEAQRAPLPLKGAIAGWFVTAALVVAAVGYLMIALRSAQQEEGELQRQGAAWPGGAGSPGSAKGAGGARP